MARHSQRLERIEAGIKGLDIHGNSNAICAALRERAAELLGPPEFWPLLTVEEQQWLDSVKEAVCAKP